MYIGFFDGACEPVNPGGNMGIGAVLYKVEDKTLLTSMLNQEKTSMELFGELKPIMIVSQCIMKGEKGFYQTSNNVAEYLGAMAILKHLNDLNAKHAYIFGDSKLVVEQMCGNWRIKKGAYVTYAQEAKEMLKKEYRFFWIPRDYNDIGDDLSKGKMIDRGVKFKIQPND